MTFIGENMKTEQIIALVRKLEKRIEKLEGEKKKKEKKREEDLKDAGSS